MTDHATNAAKEIRSHIREFGANAGMSAHSLGVITDIIRRHTDKRVETSPFAKAVQAELDHAYAKHGRDPWGRHEFYAILKEEVDEVWDAIKSDAPMQEVIKELRQIACVCQRYAETGDRYRGEHPHVPHRDSTREAALAGRKEQE